MDFYLSGYSNHALKVTEELKKRKKQKDPTLGVIVATDSKEFTRCYEAERMADRGQTSEVDEMEAEAELTVDGADGIGSEVGEEPMFEMNALEQCLGCDDEFELSSMRQFNGQMLCHPCVNLAGRIERRETNVEDDSSESNDEGEDGNNSDASDDH